MVFILYKSIKFQLFLTFYLIQLKANLHKDIMAAIHIAI